MKSFALLNSGLEEFAQEEVKELLDVEAKFSPEVVEFETKNKEELLSLAKRIQAVRRILVSLGKTKNIDDFEFKDIDWKTFLPQKFLFRVEVENVKGQEARIEIAKKIAGKFFKDIEKKNENIQPKIELKKPELLLIVYFNQHEYFLGIDFNVEELNSREYRVFAHQASFKGDLAYYFVRKSGFKPQEKLLVGFCKDGAMAIEAGLFVKKGDTEDKNTENKIFAFDETQQNVTAARKNAKLAGINEIIEINRCSLDELDVKFTQNEFDGVIFHVTTKDEAKLNELYYQSSYILKKKGSLLLIGRKNWELSISDKFVLKDETEISRGDSITKIWLLKKK